MFAVWRRKVKERIEKGTLQITLEEFKNIGVRDMMGDMKAHSILRVSPLAPSIDDDLIIGG